MRLLSGETKHDRDADILDCVQLMEPEMDYEIVNKRLKNGRWIKARVKKRDGESRRGEGEAGHYDLCPCCCDPMPPGARRCPTCGE